jgi:5'-3' exonuclease
MIIVDYSAVSIAALYANGINEVGEIDEGMVRHIILNTLRSYNMKFKDKYGNMILAMDAGNVWRKDSFPQYKANRKKSRGESKLDWNMIFDSLNAVSREIRTLVPWKSLKLDRCEADDIIAVLCQENQEFGKKEPILIISGDKDFKQLQKFSNVRQWAPREKKYLVEKDPAKYLRDHIISGDAGDGVPNILSADNVLVDGIRQTVLSAKRKAKLEQGIFDTEDIKKQLARNTLMVDLEMIPQDIKDAIIELDATFPIPNGGTLLNYFIESKSSTLIPRLTEFY